MHRDLRLISIAVAIVLAPLLAGGYVYDDIPVILESPQLREPSGIVAVFGGDLFGAERPHGLYRPLTMATLALEGAATDFRWPALSHAINLCLHLVVVALLYRRAKPLGRGVAAASALLFGVHPVLLDAVGWVSGRGDLLATALMLWALQCMQGGASAPSRRTKVLVFAAALAGQLAKETAFILPLLAWIERRAGVRPYLPALLLAALVALAARAAALDGFLPGSLDRDTALLAHRPLEERVLVAAKALSVQVARLIVPFGLAADHRAHPLADRDAPADAVAVLALLAVLALAGCVLWHRERPWAASVLMGLAGLLPVAQIVPIGAVMADRWSYLPAVFWLPMLCAVLLSPRMGRFGRAVLALAILGCAVTTIVRSNVYRDRIAFTRDVIDSYPWDYRAWNNLGVALDEPLEPYETHERDPAGADAAFAQAMALRPSYRMGVWNRVRARLTAPGSPDLEPIEGWLAPWIRRGEPEALMLSGKAFLRRAERTEDGAELARHALERHLQAASAYLERGRPDRAARAFKDAGLAARRAGDDVALVAAYREALRLDPGLQDAPAMRRAIEGR